jgi:hypothetical protein
MNKFSDWQWNVGLKNNDLDSFSKISDRAYALISKNNEELKNKDGALNVIGIVHAMEGLDYHFERFQENSSNQFNKNRMHDITAYLNRLGQLHYSIKSTFVKSKIDLDKIQLTPKINELIELRMKNTAHRSIDCPKNESEDLQRMQSIRFLGFDFFLFDGNEYFIFPSDKLKEGKIFIEFHPVDDHKKIMNEAYSILEKLITQIVEKS